MPSSREIGICTRAFIRTFGSDHKTLNRLTLAELHLPDSVCWQQGPMAVMEAIVKQVDMVEATGNFEGFEKLCALEKNARENSRHARFFVTKSFQIGLAPLEAAIGDQIAIISSGDAPFVLRPVPFDYAGQEAYRIIGGCTVDGMTPCHTDSLQYRLTNNDRFDARGSRTPRSRPYLQ